MARARDIFRGGVVTKKQTYRVSRRDVHQEKNQKGDAE
jgi:hypothetical protein